MRSLPIRKRSENQVTVSFKGGVVSFKAPFWWPDSACIRHAQESLGRLGFLADGATVEREAIA